MKTIFRYPGGKSKVIYLISPYWNKVSHAEYREPFTGGGSVFGAKRPVKVNWINDINPDIVGFYKTIQDPKQCEELIQDLLAAKVSKELYDQVYDSKPKTDYERAFKFYFLNKTSFSGIVKWRAYTGTHSWNIKNSKNAIRLLGKKLETKNYKITCMDFEKVITEPTDNDTFLFLDPPYIESRQQAAYTHAFVMEDHIRLAKVLKETKHNFLLTYDDTPKTRELYSWANMESKTWTYSVANAKVHHNPRESGNELFIWNFQMPSQRKLFD